MPDALTSARARARAGGADEASPAVDTARELHRLILQQIDRAQQLSTKQAKRPAELRANCQVLRSALEAADVERTDAAREREMAQAIENRDGLHAQLADAHKALEAARHELDRSEASRLEVQSELRARAAREKELQRELVRSRADLAAARRELSLLRPFQSRGQMMEETHATKPTASAACPRLEPPNRSPRERSRASSASQRAETRRPMTARAAPRASWHTSTEATDAAAVVSEAGRPASSSHRARAPEGMRHQIRAHGRTIVQLRTALDAAMLGDSSDGAQVLPPIRIGAARTTPYSRKHAYYLCKFPIFCHAYAGGSSHLSAATRQARFDRLAGAAAGQSRNWRHRVTPLPVRRGPHSDQRRSRAPPN